MSDMLDEYSYGKYELAGRLQQKEYCVCNKHIGKILLCSLPWTKIALRALRYLKHHQKGEINFDTQIAEDIEEEKLNEGWKDLYPLANEKISKDAQIPKGKGLKIIVEVDTDHAYDLKLGVYSLEFDFI